MLNELPEINASSTEQGVGVDYHALTKCNVNKTKSSCKHDESSQVQDSETLTDTFDNTDTAAVVKEVLRGKGSKAMRKVNVQALKNKSSDLKLCLSQQTNAFGFLPITNLQRLHRGHSLKPNKVLTYTEFDPIRVHEEVKNTGLYNFQKAKVQLPSSINFELFEKLCEGYWDYQLPYFIKFGFPLDFPHDKQSKLQSADTNHNSAVNFPSHVDCYLKTEAGHAAIYGPYKDPPYGTNTQVSPFMSRDKPDSSNRRIIIDLSWPMGASINSFTAANHYLTTVYKLQYPTIDNITEHLNSLGEGSQLFKIDLSRAFRQLRIDPRDYNLLTLKWGGQYYSDVYCPFGHRSGSMACTRLTDFFRYIMRQHGFTIYNYIDDLVGIGPLSTVDRAYKFLLELLENLRFPISGSKLEPPSTRCTCLGVIVDTESATLSVPEDKLSEVINKCRNAMDKVTISKQQLQSIIGSLMFVAKCVKPTRYFVNRLLSALREANNKTIKVNEDMKRDLKWFMTFLPRFNGTATYKHPIIEQSHTLAIDACLTGVGGVWKNKVYTAPIPDWLQQHGKMHITHFEMINIIIAIKLWGNEWVGQKVILYTDNEVVVTICNQGYTRDKVLATIARNIWLYTAEKDISLQVLHLPGKDNVIADLLSRWGGVSGQISKLHQLVNNPQWCMVHEHQFKLNTDI